MLCKMNFNWMNNAVIMLVFLDTIILYCRYIEENLDITVPSVGIVGKGYGGFVAIYGVTDEKFDERIKCAVATAPIADWRLYSKYHLIFRTPNEGE